jgi:hypothetical protein
MSRTFRFVMLLSVASLGACSESPTAPAAASPPAATKPKQSPIKASPDGVCDYVNPWSRC